MSPQTLVFSTTYKTRMASKNLVSDVKEPVIGQLKDSEQSHR